MFTDQELKPESFKYTDFLLYLDSFGSRDLTRDDIYHQLLLTFNNLLKRFFLEFNQVESSNVLIGLEYY